MPEKFKILFLQLLKRYLPLCLLLNFKYSFSQDPAKILGRINIASPNAAAIGKYGDIPVSFHTGVPNINIPLHTIKTGPLQLPISLSYHASGLRVEESDSWVGAGWILAAGGVISRTVMDKPDEKQTSSIEQTYGHFSDYGVSSYFEFADNNREYNIDNEPDLFSFNFNGFSGKFYFNDDRTPIIIDNQDFKIECKYTPGIWYNSPGAWSGLGRCIESFVITTPDGTRYYFGIPTAPVTSPYCDPIEVTSTYSTSNGTALGQVISSWFLNKIVSVDGNFTISFNYIRDKYAFYTYSNPIRGFFESFADASGSIPTQIQLYRLAKNFVAGVQLDNIKTQTEKISFTTGLVRQDLSRWASSLDESIPDNINQSSKALGALNISDLNGVCHKKYVFNYDYFIDTTSQLSQYFISSNYGNNIINSDQKRLKLISLQEKSGDESIVNPPYQFLYFSEPIVRKLSFAKDHWGYNNGAINNLDLFPPTSDNNGNNPTSGAANRNSSWPAMRGGTLNKIIYPTGGVTTFDFEPHSFTIINSAGQSDQIIGGLRIKTISNYDPLTGNTNVKNFNYQSINSTYSSGVLYGKPTYIQLFRNDMLKKTNYFGLGINNVEGCWDGYFATSIQTRNSYIYSDNPIRPMENTKGYHIGYAQVKVSQVGNGYSIYRYNTTSPWLIDRSSIAITHVNNTTTCDPSIPNFPPAPIQTNYERGELTYEGNFLENGNVLSEKEFYRTFQDNPITIPGRASFMFSNASSTGGIHGFHTIYEIKTARIVYDSTIERNYINSVKVSENYIARKYESLFHHEPTEIRNKNSKGDLITQKIQYSSDFRIPLFQNISSCFNESASYINYYNNIYNTQYSSLFNSCSGNSDVFGCVSDVSTSFQNSINNSRKAFVNCRKINFTNENNLFDSLHQVARENADDKLSTILWMQQINYNAPIEIYTLKNELLINSLLNIYSNTRKDIWGVNLAQQLKIDITSPTTFTPVSIGGNGTILSYDTRYNYIDSLNYYKGNLINIVTRNGIPESYDWGYNGAFPIAKITNARNENKESLQSGLVTKSLVMQLGANSSGNSGSFNFQQNSSGNVTITLPAGLPSGATVNGSFTISGSSVIPQTYTLCAGNCNTNSFSFSLPSGSYQCSYSLYTTFNSFSFNYSANISYQGLSIITTGVKEYFVQNFEEYLGAQSGNAHTGTSYFTGNYTVPFIPPNLKSYVIQWWSFTGAMWVLNQQNYTSAMSLSGTIDDVRVFPVDALVTTYTYDILSGITSEVDPSGKVLYYEYDKFDRLKQIKDFQGNILKKNDYQLNAYISTNPIWQSDSQIRCKPCSFNSNYTINLQQHHELDINPNSSTYNQDRWVDDNVPGTCVLLPDWQTVNTSCEQSGGVNTGNQLIVKQDYNPCSSTYNQQQTIVSYNTAFCPLPVQNCSISSLTGYSIATNAISRNGSSVSFYLVFYPTSSSVTSYSPKSIGIISGGCVPSVTRGFTYTSGSNTWSVTINTSGQITVTLISGPGLARYSSSSISGTYNL